MRVAIHQPQYFPYLGLFQKAKKADIFVFLDTVQFVKQEWMGRNRILRVKNGSPWIDWLTLTVKMESHRTPINEVYLFEAEKTLKRHYDILKESYRKAPGWKDLQGSFDEFFSGAPSRISKFSELAELTTLIGFDLLNVEVEIRRSSEMELSDNPTQRLVDICRKVGATTYIAGQGAHNYMDESLFTENGISVEYHEFEEKPYPQIQSPSEFIPRLSFLDLVFNMGEDSPKYL